MRFLPILCLFAASSFAGAPIPEAAKEAAAAVLLADLDPEFLRTEQQSLRRTAEERAGTLPVLLFRFCYDVTGDGIPEVFLAASNEDIALEWTVYRVEKDAPPRKLGGGVRLRPGNIYIGKTVAGTKRFSAFERLEDRDWALVEYHFDPSGAIHDQTRRLTEVEKIALRRGQRRAEFGLEADFVVEVERAVLGSVRADGKTLWHPYDLTRSPADQANPREVAAAIAGLPMVKAPAPAALPQLPEPPVEEKHQAAPTIAPSHPSMPWPLTFLGLALAAILLLLKPKTQKPILK